MRTMTSARLARLAHVCTSIALVTTALPASAQVDEDETVLDSEEAAASAGRAMGATSGDDEARALFELGRTEYASGRYDDALAHFERAYALSGRPELLYNMAQCFDRLRRDEDAIDALERYLAALPEASNRPEVEARLEALRAAVRDREWAAAAWTPPAADPDPAPAAEGGVETQWWFWTILGVAVVGAGVGIGLGVGLSGETVAAAPPGDVGPGGVISALVTF